jgi:hypothetical protein
MNFIGMLLIAIGIADFAGVQLPDLLWQFSTYIEMGLGYFIMSLSDKE